MQAALQVRFAGNRPRKQHSSDAGFDLVSVESCLIDVGSYMTVGTGTFVAVPLNHVGLIAPRSGLAARFGITVLNSPGIIDPGYRGEVRVPLINHGMGGFVVAPGDRIAQLLIVPLAAVEFVEDYDVSDELTSRGHGGFGSTGIGGQAA